jgi:hypothetical protein
MIWLLVIFFIEEPRSRRYGRATPSRLIVQPYEKDEDDKVFLLFRFNGAIFE